MQWKNILTSSDRVKSETGRGKKHWKISTVRLIPNLYRFKRIYPGKLPYENLRAAVVSLPEKRRRRGKKKGRKEERKEERTSGSREYLNQGGQRFETHSPADSYRRPVYARCDCIGRHKSVLVVRESRRSHQKRECRRCGRESGERWLAF